MSKSHSLTSFLYVCPFVHTNVFGMDVHDNCEFKTLDIPVRVMDMSYKNHSSHSLCTVSLVITFMCENLYNRRLHKK